MKILGKNNGVDGCNLFYLFIFHGPEALRDVRDDTEEYITLKLDYSENQT